MSTRAQLEETLRVAAQRARTLRLRSPAPPLRERGRHLVGVLAVIAILVASGAAMFFAVNITTPKTDVTATVSPSLSPSASPSASTSIPIIATPVAMMVCTDITDGRLHVRFAAGRGSEVRGYLTEGEAVQIALASDDELNSQMIQSDLWLRISSPIAGWVNARYLCKSE